MNTNRIFILHLVYLLIFLPLTFLAWPPQLKPVAAPIFVLGILCTILFSLAARSGKLRAIVRKQLKFIVIDALIAYGISLFCALSALEMPRLSTWTNGLTSLIHAAEWLYWGTLWAFFLLLASFVILVTQNLLAQLRRS